MKDRYFLVLLGICRNFKGVLKRRRSSETRGGGTNAWFPPFRCRSAICRFAFRSAVPLFHCDVLLPLRMRMEMLETTFLIHRDEETRTLIGCPPMTERQKWD